VSVRSLGAQTTTHQQLVWFGYFATADVNAQWYTVGEFQERRWSETLDVHQRLWRAHVMRRLSPTVSVGAGFTYFLQGPQAPDAPHRPLVPEYRPHLQFEARQRAGQRLSFSHRTRLEFRAFSRTSGGEVVSGLDLASRLRYRFAADWRIRTSPGPSVVLRASDELHLMFGDRSLSKPYDQNRLQLGAVIPAGRDVNFEVAYLWWYQQRESGDWIDRDIARVIVHHRVRRDTP
jgi:hypothetical protein